MKKLSEMIPVAHLLVFGPGKNMMEGKREPIPADPTIPGRLERLNLTLTLHGNCINPVKVYGGGITAIGQTVNRGGGEGVGSGHFYIYCLSCNGTTPDDFRSPEAAHDAWNASQYAGEAKPRGRRFVE
jgi:hypothetical protein